MRFQSSGGYAGITIQGQGSCDAHSYLSLDNATSSRRWLISHRVPDQSNSLFFSYFNVTQWNEQVAFKEYDINIIGLGLGTTIPTAKLHTDGNIRFQNLPADIGDYVLTVDLAGNVYTTDPNDILSNFNDNNNTEYLLQRIEQLEEKLKQLEANTKVIDNKNILFQNFPNPTNDGTTIKYSISEIDNSYITIYNGSGVKLKEYHLLKNEGSIEIMKGDLNSGNYIYSLSVNGKNIDSK